MKVSRIYLAPRIKEVSIVRKILGKLPYPLSVYPLLSHSIFFLYSRGVNLNLSLNALLNVLWLSNPQFKLIFVIESWEFSNSVTALFLSANIEGIVDIFFCTDMISIFNIGSPTVYATNTTNCTINTQHRSSRRR